MKLTIPKLFFTGLVACAISTSAMAAKNLKMSTISPGTSAYLTMTTMATMINQAQDNIHIKVDATGAATKHQIQLAKGDIDISMMAVSIYGFLKNNKAMYKKLKNGPELAAKLKLLYWFPYGQYHVVAYADSDIKSLKDIKGKKVFLGPPGGGAWKTAQTWIKNATGYEVNKDYDNVKASWSSALQGFQDRQFDVYVTGGVAPFPQIEQLTLSNKLRILGFSKDELAANAAANRMTQSPGREVGVIKAGVYGDGVVNTDDVYTLGSVVGVGVNQKMDNETAYQLTRLFWEGVRKNQKTHPWLADFNMDYAVQDGGMTLHPGALKYYKEQGVKIPAASM